jgi:hypothetical protein
MRTVDLNPKTLRTIAGLNGNPSVAELARRIGRSRAVLYHALRNPNRYRPTVAAIKRALPRRTLPIQ